MSITTTDKNNQILKEIINNSWSGIGIIDKSSKFIYVNEAFSPILGFSKDELLELSLENLLLPKYKIQFQQLLLNNHKSEYMNNILVGCIRKDKQLVYLDISIKLMSNKKHIVINVNDVTKTISDHEIFDKYVIQIHVNNDGIIKEVSEAFCRLSLYDADELVGESYTKLFDPTLNDENLSEQVWQSLQENKQWTGEVVSKNKHGDNFYVDVIVKPIQNKYGDIIGYSAVMFDITSEINLQKNTKQLKETIVDNEQKLEIMTDTIRTVAHEWRQPLNTISLDAQNLLLTYKFDEKVSKDEAVSILESVQSNVNDLSNIITNFQYITEFRGTKENLNIEDLFSEAIVLSNVNKSIINCSYKKEINLFTYKKELIKIVSNILRNAQEAIDKVANDNKFISIIFEEYDNSYKIAVSNNGGNIPENILSKIFTPYFSTKEDKNGVGLSLYIAKMIVDFHLKGKITIKNKENDVVEFSIILPKEEKE